MSFHNKFNGKKVLITGHTGFKGSWLTLWLYLLGADITGISLNPKTSPSNFNILGLSKNINDKRIDILDKKKLEKEIIETQPDFIFHLAAQAIVRESYKDPSLTWNTNLIGTINVLDSLKKLDKKCAAVLVTSDKCYKNKEWIWGYRENDELGGIDPYSASKASTEIAIKSYISSFFSHEDSNIRISSARAGNVIGGGDWSSDRLMPDCMRSWSNNEKVILRNPESTRPWQHVLEPLSGYLLLAERLYDTKKIHGESFNFGPKETETQTVLNVVKEISKYWKKVSWEIEEDYTNYESGLLKLNCDKALHILKWMPTLDFSKTIQMTSEWYMDFYNNKIDMRNLATSQIKTYCEIAKEKNLEWSL